MSLHLTFVLPKDPGTEYGGDLTLVAVAAEVARRRGHRVHTICLSGDADRLGSTADVTRVRKPVVSAARLAYRSVRTRRSLVHSRYDTPELVEVLRDRLSGTDVVIAEHTYMAESVLRARPRRAPRLLVNTSVLESGVWAGTRGAAGRVEAVRIRADERRVLRAAHSVATYDRDEIADLRRLGAARPVWLGLTLPPARTPVPVVASPPRLLFVGDRRWPPNDDAARLLCRWWPEIRSGVDDAELWLVGRPGAARGPGASGGASGGPGGDRSIRELGAVDDLDGVMAGCRALAAPVRTGGGVRVKLLHAASVGLPSVTTRAGLGSLGGVLGSTACRDPREFVGRCRDLLRSPERAAVEGRRVYDANAAHWVGHAPADRLERWWTT